MFNIKDMFKDKNFQIVKGNLLKDFDGDIIAHQVNCKGVMGGGIAHQIKNIFPETFKEYQRYCKMNLGDVLGSTLITDEKPFAIASLFGQDGFGRDSVQTDYEALERALYELKDGMEFYQLFSVGFPYMIGCGLAGGDVDTVMNMVKKVFKDSDMKVTFYKYEKEGVRC